MARCLAVARSHAVARKLRRLDHVLGPARERLARIVVVEMHPYARCRIEPASERIRWRCRGIQRDDEQIEHALILGGVGVALLHNVIAPGEVAVELASRARSEFNGDFAWSD